MQEQGLTRIPFYPELKIFDRESVFNDYSSMVLSILLYWHSQHKYQKFNARAHAFQLAKNLYLKPEQVKDALEYFTEIGILDKSIEIVKNNSENPEKKEKLNEFYALNFSILHTKLKEKNLDIPVKVLRLAADDYFDFYAYISERRLPLVQGLIGMIKGDEYNQCALNICKILCGICEEPQYEDFSLKALAPGWRMLCQPPASPKDVAERYTRDEERSIDVDLMDGAFFVPDGDFFGTEKHKIWHCGKKQEPRVLASALYLTVAAISKNVEFYSDLSLDDLKPAFLLMHHFTGLKPRLSELYFDYLDLQGEKREQAKSYYQKLINEL